MKSPASGWADDGGYVQTLVGDGRPLLVLAALSLIAFGAFAMFLAAGGQFLPHDIEFLGMTASSSAPCTDAGSSTS